ncbi:MAG TPA: methyltransferase domain-containing protein [Acidimicrobiales bacterium]|nr:methyltransferase domain-containing protein [Acidimicrobiales bacterium]
MTRALPGRLILDVGCGPGGYTAALENETVGDGAPMVAGGVIGLDLSAPMLARARAAGARRLVRADLAALPFRHRAFGGAWSRHSHLHVPRTALPLALARLHWAMEVDAPLTMSLWRGEGEGVVGPDEDEDLPGRFFARWRADEVAAVVVGAGFDAADVSEEGESVWVQAIRARALADAVGPGMRVLVCGLNPSLVAADAGFGYAGPTNRFWRAAVESGLVTRPKDPAAALRVDGVGMTDLVKRATRAASELGRSEYQAGAERVRALVEWLRPRLVLFVGLAGWRAAVDRRAGPGLQEESFGGMPAYVMPSTSGLNAATSFESLVAHMAAACAIAGPATS